VENIVNAYRDKIRAPNFFFAPYIPSAKLLKALIAYARAAATADEKVLALIDTTTWGSTRRGAVLTDKKIYAHNGLWSSSEAALGQIACIELRQGRKGRVWDVLDGRKVEDRARDLFIDGRFFLRFTHDFEAVSLFAAMLEEMSKAPRPEPSGQASRPLPTPREAPAWEAGPLTAEQDLLLKGTNRAGCMACLSTNLRPLIVLTREGFPPGDSRHSFVYSHDAIFACDVCHAGYAEIRQHDCFDFEEVFDEDSHFALDAASIAQLVKALPDCPNPFSETCICKIHQSLRSKWKSLPRRIWDAYNTDFPRPLLQMADPDQEKWVISRVCIQVFGGLPMLVSRNGGWMARYQNGNPKAKGSFRDGLLDGQWTFWHKNGQKKAEGQYRSDQREGNWTEWNDRGEIISQQKFKSGRQVSP